MGDPWHGIGGGHSLHDWLIDSSYVKPNDDMRRNGSRKKGRTRGDRDHVFAGPTLTHVAMKNGDGGGGYVAPAAAPGKRKTRRWTNERLLRDLAGPLDAAAIGALYAPPPWGQKTERPMLERVTSVDFGVTSDMTAWEPFRSVDMDRQSQLLAGREGRKQRQEPAALAAWRAVERSAREALRRSAGWPLVLELEEKLVLFQQEEQAAAEELLVELESPFQRLLLHGLCQFHGLTAGTIDEVPSQDGLPPICVIAIHRRHRHPLQSGLPPEPSRRLPPRLVEFLTSGGRAAPNPDPSGLGEH